MLLIDDFNISFGISGVVLRAVGFVINFSPIAYMAQHGAPIIDLGGFFIF